MAEGLVWPSKIGLVWPGRPEKAGSREVFARTDEYSFFVLSVVDGLFIGICVLQSFNVLSYLS